MRYCLSISLALLFLVSSAIVSADTIILVGKTDPINANDTVLMERLQGMGLDVEYHSEPEAHPVPLGGAAGVFISESVSSGNIGPTYTDLNIPVITSEGGLIDDLGMGVGQNSGDVTTIEIVDPNHPITQGFSGQVEVLSQASVLTGATELQGDAQVLATLADGSGWPRLFVYEEGAQMIDMVAPARRAFVYNHQNTNPRLNDDGWMLIERAIEWALGYGTSAVSHDSSLITTWSAIKVR
jgi:hypothetical protein